MGESREITELSGTASGESRNIPLEQLQLDAHNPRFGDSSGTLTQQNQVLDWIVENFGVEDVINSLAINGYFEAEPLVVEENQDGTYTVKEGNRRLAACLILAKDPRAKRHQAKRKAVEKFLGEEIWSPTTEIPTICFKTGDAAKLVAYLGVRHIVSSQPWDSYAKAAWISKVIDEGRLTIDQISELTGDKSQTISKLLEGYNFVQQLQRSGLFNPKSSSRRGRGSNIQFPFSWIYTVLQFKTARDWLKLGPYSTKKNPIPQDREEDAALLLTYMFGDSFKSITPKIDDSRDLGALAKSISIPQRRELLRTGATLKQVEELSRPPAERLLTLLVQSRQNLRDASAVLSEEKFSSSDATDLIEIVRAIRKLAASAHRTLEAQANDGLDDDEF